MAEKHEAETKQTATDAAVNGKNTATTEQTASKVQPLMSRQQIKQRRLKMHM